MKQTPLSAIRKFCIGCMGGNKAEVRKCTSPTCDLFVFRFGKNPNVKRRGNGETLRKWKEANKNE